MLKYNAYIEALHTNLRREVMERFGYDKAESKIICIRLGISVY